jgi:hypothetical protein
MNSENATQIHIVPEDSIWLCHVCGKASRGEGVSCEICFRTACPLHLQRTSIYNKASGLYEFTTICTNCKLAEFIN